MSGAVHPHIDRLGALLAAFAAAALLFLPFVIEKANRIVPGVPRMLAGAVPPAAAGGTIIAIVLAALVAICIAHPQARLCAALLAVVVVCGAVAAAGNALTPPGNKVVRVAPGSG